jgi:transcriptional antiterminator RfaH
MSDAYWGCVKTHAQKEVWASERLTERGVEIFLPRIANGRGIIPLFKSYCFVRVVEGRWMQIERTMGVIALVRFGDAPARCPTREVELLMDKVGPDGVLHLPPPPPPAPRLPIRKGAKVKVTSGPFAGLGGLYQGMGTRERELVLMRCLGATRTVALPRHALAVVT